MDILQRALWLGAITSVFASGGVQGQMVEPLQGTSIELGAFAGAAYYSVEPDGYCVVMTIQSGEGQSPIRVVATLASGQSIKFSAPRGVGQSPFVYGQPDGTAR